MLLSCRVKLHSYDDGYRNVNRNRLQQAEGSNDDDGYWRRWHQKFLSQLPPKILYIPWSGNMLTVYVSV